MNRRREQMVGSNAGPGVSGQGCDSVEGEVSFDPWLVLTITVDPTTIQKKTGTWISRRACWSTRMGMSRRATTSRMDEHHVPGQKACKLSGPSSDNTQGGEAETEVKARNETGSCQAKASLDAQKEGDHRRGQERVIELEAG
jgi:hypothetical protein